MDFTDKYISTADATVKPDPLKITLSDDAYAIGEQIEKLLKELSFRLGRI